MDDEPSKTQLNLDYAAPRGASSTHAAIIGILGVFCGLFACLMIVFGIVGLLYVLRHPNSADRTNDIAQTVMFFAIGLVGAFTSFRWCRGTIRRRRDA